MHTGTMRTVCLSDRRMLRFLLRCFKRTFELRKARREDRRRLEKELFIKQIELANKFNLPIQIHTRDAHIDTISILKEHSVNNKGIFHCCPLNQELIKEAVGLGYYISFCGNITFKNAKADEIIKAVPDDKFLIETDCPYLSPEPNRGKRNV